MIKSTVSDVSYLIIDEIGDPAYTMLGSVTFGFAVSITSHPDSFAAISYKERQKPPLDPREEIKFKGSTNELRFTMLNGIRNLGTETYGAYVDKRINDYPEKWKGNNRAVAFRMVLTHTMYHVMKNTRKNNFILIIDDHSAIKEGRGCNICGEIIIKSGKNMVDCFQSESTEDDYSDHLQTHDFVAGAMNRKIRDRDDTFSSIVSTNIHRIRRN